MVEEEVVEVTLSEVFTVIEAVKEILDASKEDLDQDGVEGVVVETRPITTTEISQYSVTEGLLLTIVVILFADFMLKLIGRFC